MKAMNKKGFTLIELLAVIVILAVIALIATPLILNVINTAKKGAAQDSAYAYIRSVESNEMARLIENPGATWNTVHSSVDNTIVKNTVPESVNLTLSNGSVTGGTITVSGYSFVITADGKLSDSVGA